MSFVSAAFAALYLIALALRAATRATNTAYLLGILALSWVFYAWHVPWYILLLLSSTVVNYGAARLIAATPPSSSRAGRGVLLACVALNLTLLGTFKYTGFLAATLADLSGSTEISIPEIVLPIGISFYTFQAISYVVDVYRGHVRAERSFLRVACYLAFFPQLVAGPIVRAGDFLYQLRRRRRIRLAVVGEGAYLIVRGLFLKVVIADNLGRIVDAHWMLAATGEASALVAPSLLVFCACQLFSDFAGYTDIARGLAYTLGFRLPINFNAPYLASTFTDFWRRWHITLSTWFRDYVYVPLGGNRRGRTRAYVNLIVVMLVAGLWHGASWTFVLWGAVHGVAVAVERALGLAGGPKTAAGAFGWYVVVQTTWVLSMGMFRADDAQQGWVILRSAVSGVAALTSGVWSAEAGGLIVWGWWLVLPVAASHARALLSERYGVCRPRLHERAAYAGAMLAATLTLYTGAREFLYFQF